MKRILLLALLSCWLAVPVYAQDAEQAVTIRVTVAQSSVTFVAGARFVLPLADDAGTRLENLCWVEQTADGKLRIRTIYVVGGKLAEALYAITPHDGPIPAPIPTPTPTPTPQPSTVAAVYLIHESADGTPALTVLKADLAWKEALDANSVRWLIADDDAAEKSLPNVAAMARKQGLPAVVWVSANGLGASKPCPATSADMLALLREIGVVK